ncbi:MAG TPA: tetratricopeptide repeat protein [Chthoniobacterales bacterium]|nr:tetratricopeptide repeat protein [Chthoniobacterales bacterium]
MRPSISKFAVCIGLIAITWAVFGQTARYGFVNYDDPAYVSENPHVQAGLSWNNVVWAFTHVHSHNWHPLTTMSHMLDCQLFGLKPGAHHVVNVLLHSASAVLLFWALLAFTGNVAAGIGDAGPDQRSRLQLNLWRSAFVAAIFAIHPLHVESVAWISERKDVLSGLFFMLTLLAYARYARKPTLARYATVTLLFACGLLSKPMLVTLPVVLLLLDYWPLGRMRNAKGEARSEKRREQSGKGKMGFVSTTQPLNSSTSSVRGLVVEKIPLFVLAIGSAVATLIAQRGGILEVARLPLSWRIGNAATVYLIYIWQMIWPQNLAVIYPHPGQLPFWETAAAGALIIFLTAFVFIARKRAPYLLTGWLWYVIMLIPVIGLVQVGSQAHADRYTYLSQIGIYIAVVWGIADLLQSFRYRREIFSTAAPVIIAALGWRSWVQTGYWHDTERLWNRTIAVTGQNDFARFALGEYLLKVHRLDEAITQFETVLAGHPKDPDMNFQMGCALMEKGEASRAITYFQTSLKFKPQNSDAETNLGNLLLKGDRIAEAIEHYRNVVARDPSSPLAHYNLAVGLHRAGKLAEAIAEYKETLALDPNYPDAKEFLEQAQLQNDQSSPDPNKH